MPGSDLLLLINFVSHRSHGVLSLALSRLPDCTIAGVWSFEGCDTQHAMWQCDAQDALASYLGFPSQDWEPDEVVLCKGGFMQRTVWHSYGAW